MRTTVIEYDWKEDPTLLSETATVCIVDGLAEYKSVSADYGFDETIFFYFFGEEQFRNAFDSDNCEFEFTIIREID